ncbi:hypothetical protein [Winogradskyella sp. PC D3.3]
MLNKEYFIDLLSLDTALVSIHHINWWLIKYEDEFYNAIPNSECGKWSKWLRDNSINVFPCACHTREQDCIFIEMYFELLKVSELEKQEVRYKKPIEVFNSIKHDEDKVALWLEEYESLWHNLQYNKVIRVKITTEPYTRIEIQLNADDFKNIATFKKLYYRCYHAIT